MKNYNLHSTLSATKRGDTIIEVMFAIAVFCLVAVISISMMNTGVASAENSLEVVTVRNELNAQAEALRFIHSSYISELTLHSDQQQYSELWQKITDNAISPSEYKKFAYPPNSCTEIYNADDDTSSVLGKYNAFILNTRNLTPKGSGVDSTYISTDNHNNLFRASPLAARIIYGTAKDPNGATSDEELSETAEYDRVRAAEGIWAIAVRNAENKNDTTFYDFYIQTCWYGPNALRPTTLDTVIRLYNPAGVK